MSESSGTPDRPRLSRRSVLAGGAVGATASTVGCMRRLRSIVNRDGIGQLSLTITVPPADHDREGLQLARYLRDVLEAVGADVAIELQSEEEFLRTILLNHDFDCFVARHPGATDPDFLHEALYSLYADESGWQNPYGYTNLLMDDLLEEQRAAEGEAREAAVERLLEAFVRERPFVPICVPDEVRVVRSDRFDGWGRYHPATRLGYVGLEPNAGVDELRTVVVDARPSQNLNPLAAEYRNRGTFVDLLYDSLATRGEDGTLVPWLAESWEWDEGSGTLSVRLRDGITFHDGEPLGADDVAFTYRFVEDTSLGAAEVASPSPRYRGLVSAVEDVSTAGDRDLTMSIAAGETVAERALTVPVLPEHVWEERASEASVPGVAVAQGTTEAVVSENVPPIGSGPFRFEERAPRDDVELVRFDDHFTRRGDVDLPSVGVERFHAEIDPRSTSAIEVVETGDADASVSTLDAYTIDEVDEGHGVDLLRSPSWTFYHVGFNARTAPFGNPHFRRVFSRLIDREWLVEEVFEGYARPTAVPVTEEWTPESLSWDDGNPVAPFLGTDGDVDVAAARDAFVDAGFRYDGEGTLLVRQ